MSLIVDINPVPWKILDLVKARILKNRAKKAKKGIDWSKETMRREMVLQPVPLLSRKKDEPSFTPSGSVHYSISILDQNTEYLKGTLTGTFYSGGIFRNFTTKWFSKSEPVVTPFYRLPGLQATLGPDPGIPAFRVTLVDGFGGFEYSSQSEPSDQRGGLILGNVTVTTTGNYSSLLNRDWESWSSKTTFSFNSQNGLGEVVNAGSISNKRFILLIPKIQGSAGIEVYPDQWPGLAGSSSVPVGFAITVARQDPFSTVTGPSDYYSLIEAATGIPWSEVESVQVGGGVFAALSDELSFLAKLTEESIPYSRSFGNTYTGNPFDDQESWVYPHSITP